MILAAIIAFGFAAAAAALTLARLEIALNLTRGTVASPFGDATATMVAWAAFGTLSVAGLIAIGIPVTVCLALVTLGAGRLTPAFTTFARLFPLKGLFAGVSMALAIVALVWTLSLIQGVANG